MSQTHLTRATRTPAGVARAALVVLVLAALLVGCGSDEGESGGQDTAAAGAPSGAPSGAPDGGRPGGGRVGGGMPGTFGEIAAVDGDVLQVQNQRTGQVAVTVTADTTVTDQAAAKLADVTAGVCVVVRSADTGDDADPDAGASTEVAATSVAISEPEGGGCTAGSEGGGGPRRGDGERPTGMATDLPSGSPSNLPSGGPRGGRRGGFGILGEVGSVAADGFVVEGRNGEVTVTVAADTTYTKQVASDAAALTVGRCVRVEGDADDTGAVTAEKVQVSDKVEDQCGR